MTDLDKLIAAVEAGKCWLYDSENWDRIGVDGLDASEAFYGSLDAALRLHQALLPEDVPGTFVTLGLNGGAIIHGSADGLRPDTEAALFGTNSARAWLLAILRALKAKGGA